MLRLLRTNAFRLAAVYFVLFAASVLALLVFIYFSTADFIEQQTEATIDSEITGLAEQYRQRGIVGLVEIIQARTKAQHENSTLYLLTDAALSPLAGNLTAWPNGQSTRPGWINFPVERHSRSGSAMSTALAAYFRLGDFRLLVGRDLHDASIFRARVTHTLAWAALLTLALGVAGGLLMTRNMLRRVDVVNRTSARIIHGDLTQRVPLNGSGDEPPPPPTI